MRYTEEQANKLELPEELTKQLKFGRKFAGGMSLKVLDIIKTSNIPLSLNDLVIEMYKRHNQISPRGSVQSAVYKLKKDKLVDSNMYGEWETVKTKTK